MTDDRCKHPPCREPDYCGWAAYCGATDFLDHRHTTKSDVGAETMDETAWLIELAQHARSGPPFYWGWEDGNPAWTAEHQYAKRFVSKEDAEKEADGCGLEDWVVAEHAWVRS
jgi:hypothetical protein